jgi:hypothetical protein
MTTQQDNVMPFLINFAYGFKIIEPTKWNREVRRVGFMRWSWFIESEHTCLTNGPFLTRRAALRDLARYPTP